MMNKKALLMNLFIFPDLPIDHHLVTTYITSILAFVDDEQLQKELDATFHHHVYLWQYNMMADILQQQDVLIQLMNMDDEIYLSANLPFCQ